MSQKPTQDDYALTQGARISNFLPYIEEDLVKLEGVILSKALQKALKYELEADEALRMWHEMAVIDRLRRGWRAKVAIANSTAEKLGESMTIGGKNG